MADTLLVLDTSAVIAVISNEAHKPALIEITAGAELMAPSSLPAELGNAFSAMFKRGRISLDEAKAALKVYREIPLRLTPLDLDLALELSSALGIYAYDAYVLACCRRNRAPLVTLDSGQRQAAERAGIEVLEVSI